ncbi:hypothetical protein DIE04_17400 [Burkholderia sp. Bp8994]|uniref:hypothetical protein n=1 Tax=unclassified Burkholderia TaxID=2613784 RepID=UPI000F560B8F|nr:MULTISPECIES: hypothetical protein [unclassified Burkholderia]RQR42492.1 hypothetical protein DIE20_14575 [Burkholderia sp. Bp9131]RQR72202.1 hypothetical protein DIE12_17265 [Burkholderia sp. Bp9015]RQR95326.1 hypothetical protein DIE04_17400 [Burkholderia sp. Bp8994]RQS29217.1 hypothetical protein DIE01_35260 [Burkholderia sp. Bp8990]RQZ39982.1 hypothetical protein DIE17_33840 [Burkholderia sp. Bp9099]
MTARRRGRIAALAFVLLPALVHAADAGGEGGAGAADGTAGVDAADAAALALADQPAAPPADTAKPWKLNVQDALRTSRYRDGGEAGRNQLSIEFEYGQWLTPSFAAHFSMRFDRFDPLGTSRTSSRDVTLVKEAYASWRASPAFVVDAGRVNERLGAAIGYNPTDFFRAGAVSLDVPPDPDSRHTNRLGTVGLRAQQVWDSGSLAALLSPRLERRSLPGDPAASSDLQRTNGVDRWMLVASQRLTAAIQPQWIVYGESGQAPQFGQNLSVLLGNSVVAYLEWTGGYRRSLIARATGAADDRAFRTSSSVGATWTLPVDLSLTAEFQSNGGGANAAQWRSLQRANPLAWGRAVQTSIAAQELQTRHGVFVMAAWRNVGVRRLDLSGFVQADLGGGRQYWLELRRRFDRFDVALQWLHQGGPSWSRFGAMPESTSVQVLGIFYR